MENKISIIALVTVFYIFGLSAFYTGLHAGFACFVCILLIVLCLLNKINPKICVVLNLVFIFGFYNANFHNKESDSFSFINAANNVKIRGRVYSIPNINNSKKMAKFFLGCYQAKIYDSEFKPIKTRVLVSIQDDNEKYKNIKIGDVIEIEGNLRNPPSVSNPSEFNYKKYLKNKDAFVILYSNNKEFKILGRPNIRYAKNKTKEVWWSSLQKLDSARECIISKHGQYIKSPNLEVLGGIVFGDDAINPSDEVKESFINSGLLHLLAASGLNVALIFGIWWAVSSFLNFSYKGKLGAGIAIIIVYTFMTGFPPSILRASIMLIIILIGKLIFKTADNFTLIFFTGFIMLLFNPKLLNDVGFELSFLVTGGLITCVEPICTKFKEYDKTYKKHFAGKIRNFIKYAPENTIWRKFLEKPAFEKIILGIIYIFSPISLLGMVLVPLVAQFWAAPLQMYYFNTFTPYSVFANIAVVPFIGVISFAGFASSILGFIPIFGDFIIKISSYILNPLITILLNISDFFSKLPGAIIKMPSGQVFQIIIYYLIILAFILCIKEDFKKKRNCIIFGILAFILSASIIYSTAVQALNKNYEIIAFSVGNADNFLIKTPKNKYIMIDTAKLPYKGVSGAKRVTLEYLYDKNIRTLEYLIVTHFDNDHSGGVIDILENIKVKNVIVQRNTCDSVNSCNIFNYMNKNKVKYRVGKDNEIIYKEDNGFKVKTLIPNNPKINKEDDNENSIITLINNDGNYALFMGDGGIKAFNAVKKDIPKEIRVLKAGHHGAKGVINKEMLEYLKPEYTIISTGINHYGHPNINTVKMIENFGSKIYSTKDDGAIKFSFDKKGNVRIHTFFNQDKENRFR